MGERKKDALRVNFDRKVATIGPINMYIGGIAFCIQSKKIQMTT